MADQINKPEELAGEEDFASMLDNYEQHEVKDGEIVTGTVQRVEKDWVLIDIGYKSEGYVPLHEFMDENGNITVKEGDQTEVYVESRENREGYLELSKDKAEKLKIWDDISVAAERDGVVEGIVLSKIGRAHV